MRNQGIFSHLPVSKSFCGAMGLNRSTLHPSPKSYCPSVCPPKSAEALLTV